MNGELQMQIDQELYNDLYGSKYLSAADLNGQTIRRRIGKLDVAELKDPKTGTTKRRVLAYFENIEKPLVVNKTNAQALSVAYGTNWAGAVVEVYPEMTSLGKEGIRLRPVKTAADGKAANDMNDAINV
jgi:hypothetical protein